MKNNYEAGYILPTTIIIIFILCAVVIEQTRHYVLDKQFLAAEIKIFQTEELIHSAVVDLTLRSREELLETFTLDYNFGTVVCNIEEINEDALRLSLQARPNDGGVRYAHVMIDTNTGKVTEWWEVTR